MTAFIRRYDCCYIKDDVHFSHSHMKMERKNNDMAIEHNRFVKCNAHLTVWSAFL